jgi:hypothetical protein
MDIAPAVLIAKKYVKTQGEKKKLYTDYEITTA